jgi:cysteine desulfurase / selenocysteine lyase
VVADAVAGYLTRYSANVHRGVYSISEEATAAYEGARAGIARFLNAPSEREIVMVRNATEAINLVAYSWGRRHIGRADTIVATELEHHSNIVPWQLLAQEKDADLEFVAVDDEGTLNLDSYAALLRTEPKLVAFGHVSNGLGTINPVRQMVEMAHEAGALVLVDGAQAVPHGPVDVQALGCDFYVFSGHKTLAPPGSGALWARMELLDEMPPFMAGGEMITEVHLRRTVFNRVPFKFEAGTPDIAAAIGLGAALDYLSEIGMDNVRQHERELTEYALELLPRAVPSIKLYGPPTADARAGIVTFNLPSAHPHDVASLLDREAICVRAGHHCTMPLHERLDEAATLRASFNVYTDRDDIDRLADALARVDQLFSR